MYTCPGCGGSLKFNVEKQKMFCENCLYEADPEEVKEFHPAEEQAEEYEATVFRCPHCGGEILSEDSTAATFCSFCGATTVLESRIEKERKPAYILPFTKTKEDCKKTYAKILKKAPFLPDEYKNPENMDRFRGIYMPYWDYQYSKNTPFQFKGERTRRRGNYLYTDVYDVNCNISLDYRGICFDASSSFSDHLSEGIAPYYVAQKKEFTPAYLSGFYADTSDVGEETYAEIADRLVMEDIAQRIEKKSEISGYAMDYRDRMRLEKMLAHRSGLAMLPVWFLSCRNGNRVSYAVMNGQTGKVAADLPVDIKKYFKSSAIFAAVIFLFLNSEFTFIPEALLSFSFILSIVCILIINVQMTNLIARDTGQDDLGYISSKLKEQKKDGTAKKKAGGIGVLLGALLLFLFASPFLGIIIPCAILFLLSGNKRKTRFTGVIHKHYFGNLKEKLPVLVKPFLGIFSVLLVGTLLPVNDIWYYVSTLFSLLMTIFSFVDIIKYHNLLATRKLPQFNKRGGDENE